jgi:hypothetical protein
MNFFNKLLPLTISEAEMALDNRSTFLYIGVILLVLLGIYLIDPTFFGLLGYRQGFENQIPGATMGTDSQQPSTQTDADHEKEKQQNLASGTGDASSAGFANMPGMDASGEGFANLDEASGPAQFGSAASPAGCYPRDQLTPGELLPKDNNSVWAQQNPMGTGSLKGKNFLSAGALIGVNTVGQSLRNANYQLRSEPPNPQVPVSVFNNSTIEPDTNRRDFEVN